jgi:hypothetical protein
MATPDAIQDMGDSLVNLLCVAGIPGVANANINLATPDEFAPLENRAAPFPAAITIFLYRITLVDEVRNAPRRMLRNGTTTRQLLPLELHYLITPWAVRVDDEHRVAGHILQALYDRAELGPADLIGASWEPEDQVQLILEPLPMQELFDIWETTDTAFRLSLPFCARVIGIEPADILRPAPVLEARFGAVP